MKKILIFLICLVYGGGRLIAQKDRPKYLREDDKSFKEMTTRVSENGWIEFKKEAKINPQSFFKDYANSLGLSQHYDFKALNEQRDEKERLHQRFQLHYKNIPVEGMEFSLHTFEDGTLQTAHGRIVEGIDTDVSKPITERRALEIALADKKLSFDDFKEGETKLPDGTLLFAKLIRPWWCSHRQALLTA
ncbi:hypothetical protein DR864_16185 [Runella rosea]|uniref:FTP domain-containing protein n=1 Tax=Runella rosea TaxID=2259595 RepID=A0A344TKL1_9BACT|nr:hypothetical protein [Runella rosea]AXE19182.1 hypothetical protein DR864_16185 [Runella rosea]